MPLNEILWKFYNHSSQSEMQRRLTEQDNIDLHNKITEQQSKAQSLLDTLAKVESRLGEQSDSFEKIEIEKSEWEMEKMKMKEIVSENDNTELIHPSHWHYSPLHTLLTPSYTIAFITSSLVEEDWQAPVESFKDFIYHFVSTQSFITTQELIVRELLFIFAINCELIKLKCQSSPNV